MAIVKQNTLLKGLSGRLGDVVFKVLRGKTIVSKPPKKVTSSSELQQGTRTKFKEASAFAKEAMLDAERKAYYVKKAKKLNLPNAYTAALTDYMRKPRVTDLKNHKGDTELQIVKKDFNLKKIVVRYSNNIVTEVDHKHCHGNTWIIKPKYEGPFTILIQDDTGQLHSYVYEGVNAQSCRIA